MIVEDLGLMAYRQAWAYQEKVHGDVVDGAPERLLLVEHPPVITLGRRPGINRNLVASDESLRELGVEVVQSDRGGDITFHGPGQLVAYPIVRMIDHQLSVGGYVRRLEETVIAVLQGMGIAATKDPDAIGIWTPMPPHSPAADPSGTASDDEEKKSPHGEHGEHGEGSGVEEAGDVKSFRDRTSETPSPTLPRSTGGGRNGVGAPAPGATLGKICAVGVRIRRGVTMHGVALNVTTDLRYFNLIVPCGLVGRPVASIAGLLGDATPTMAEVKQRLAEAFAQAFPKG